MKREVHVELLLGRRVRDVNGEVVGRIMNVIAERRATECFVSEYHLGAAALLTRMGITGANLVGIPARAQPIRVPWQCMDLSDPAHPRLTVTQEEVRARKA